MRTLKFKPQLMVYIFRCRHTSKRTSWETEADFSGVKWSRLLVVIGRFQSILFISVVQGSLAVAIIMIDGSEKRNCQLGFELQNSHVTENRNNFIIHCTIYLPRVLCCYWLYLSIRTVKVPGLK